MMNAIEFVKQNGIEKAKQIVDLLPMSTLINIDGIGVSISDLKQIVDSFEWAEKFGGLDGFKDESDVCIHDIKRLVESHKLIEKCGGLSSAKNLGGDDLYIFFKHPFMPSFSDVDQAILDVESCL